MNETLCLQAILTFHSRTGVYRRIHDLFIFLLGARIVGAGFNCLNEAVLTCTRGPCFCWGWGCFKNITFFHLEIVAFYSHKV